MQLNQNIKSGLLLLLVLGGLYLGLRFTFGFFTPFNYYKARQDIGRNQIKLVELGELPRNHRQIVELANSFNVEIHYYGCSYHLDIENGVRYYNNTILKHLDKKYHLNWWAGFQSQLDSITTADSIDLVKNKMIGIVLKEPYFIERKQIFDSLYKNHERRLTFIAGPSPTSKYLYLVKVLEVNGINAVTLFNFLIDNKTLQVINHEGRLPGL